MVTSWSTKYTSRANWMQPAQWSVSMRCERHQWTACYLSATWDWVRVLDDEVELFQLLATKAVR